MEGSHSTEPAWHAMATAAKGAHEEGAELHRTHRAHPTLPCGQFLKSSLTDWVCSCPRFSEAPVFVSRFSEN